MTTGAKRHQRTRGPCAIFVWAVWLRDAEAGGGVKSNSSHETTVYEGCAARDQKGEGGRWWASLTFSQLFLLSWSRSKCEQSRAPVLSCTSHGLCTRILQVYMSHLQHDLFRWSSQLLVHAFNTHEMRPLHLICSVKCMALIQCLYKMKTEWIQIEYRLNTELIGSARRRLMAIL